MLTRECIRLGDDVIAVNNGQSDWTCGPSILVGDSPTLGAYHYAPIGKKLNVMAVNSSTSSVNIVHSRTANDGSSYPSTQHIYWSSLAKVLEVLV